MTQSYLNIRNEYLTKAWKRTIDELRSAVPAEVENGALSFPAFGEHCVMSPGEITLGGVPSDAVEGLLTAMYASHVSTKPVDLHPLKSFKELPNSMPYQGAFAANSERVLEPHVEAIQRRQGEIIGKFSGMVNTDAISGDFSFTLYPLPRIPLYYIFHLPDDEFPAGVSCLFAANADAFMPLDGLADVAEYTARRIIALLG